MISKATIQEVQDRMDIVDIVSDFVTLKRKGSGKYLWANCPFHDEKTPSFSVTPDRGIYKCFGCGKSGDSINFMMEHDGLSYVEAIRYLAGKYGIEIQETNMSDKDQELQNEKESLYIVLDYAATFFSRNLSETDEGKSIAGSYFRERGIDQRSIEKFQLGYSLDQWTSLYEDAKSKAYKEDLLEKAGLIVRKSEDKVYDRFRGRVIFPIHNVSGRVIAFGARTLRKDDKPKYLNSPESDVYHKSKVLYGIFQAKNQIRQQDKCYLVEGYTDVISMHEADIPNVVASSGTSLTTDQIKLISRFTKNITVLYDGDPAGIKASLRGIDMILESGMNVRTVVFPEGHDPDSYSRELGTAAFQKYLSEHEQDFISFKASIYANEAARDPIKRAESIKEILSSIAKIPDGLKRAVYIKDTSRLLEMEESVLWSELNKLIIKDQRSQRKPEMPEPPPFDYSEEPVAEDKPVAHEELIALHEREFIRLLIKYGSHADEEEQPMHEVARQELEDVEFITPVYRDIFTIYTARIKAGEPVDADYFIRNGSESVKKTVVDLISERHEVSNLWFDRFKIYVPSEEDLVGRMFFTNMARLKRSIIQKLIDEHKEKLKNTSDPDEIDELLHIQQELKRTEKQLADALGIVIPK